MISVDQKPIQIALKRDSVKKLLKNDSMMAINNVIRQNREMIWRRIFFQNVSLIMLNNFSRDKHCLKIKLKCLKKGFSHAILKNDNMTAINDVLRQKQDMIWRRFFQNISLIILSNFYHDKHCLKMSQGAYIRI